MAGNDPPTRWRGLKRAVIAVGAVAAIMLTPVKTGAGEKPLGVVVVQMVVAVVGLVTAESDGPEWWARAAAALDRGTAARDWFDAATHDLAHRSGCSAALTTAALLVVAAALLGRRHPTDPSLAEQVVRRATPLAVAAAALSSPACGLGLAVVLALCAGPRPSLSSAPHPGGRY